MTRFVLTLFICLPAICAVAGGLDLSSAYLAPVNQLVFKVVWPGGGFREFEHDFSSPGVLRSADGWTGKLGADGVIDISGPGGDGRRESFRFKKGRLVRSDIDGEIRQYSYQTAREAPDRVYPPLLVSRKATEEAAKEYSYNQYLHKWEDSGRLAFPFVNPNHAGALYSQILLLLCSLAMVMKRRALKVLAAAAAIVTAGCLVWTMSRGAWIGTILGLVCFASLGVRRFFHSRAFWIGVASVAVALVVWVGLFGSGQITRGCDGATMNWSNAIRLEIWSRAPRMMVDAPGGWNYCIPGAAYVEWYQPLRVFALTPTLINDHLTILVALPWVGRFLYLLLSFSLVGIGMGAIAIRRNPLPLALWLSLAAAAWFNPIMVKTPLLVLPFVANLSIIVVMARRNRRLCGWVAATSAGLSACVLAGLAVYGRVNPDGYIPVHCEGHRVAVNGRNPKIWIVDDGTLGGGLTGKDIREYYTYVRNAPAVGCVGDIADLPKSGVECLVLAGHAGADWLTMLSEDEKARDHLPRSVLFISPPFSPSQVPEGVRALCNPRIVVGEFAAQYDAEYANAQPWVVIVPGMEKYILRWMEHVMEFYQWHRGA